MGMRDEIRAVFSGDTTRLDQSLRSVKARVAETGVAMKKSFTKAFDASSIAMHIRTLGATLVSGFLIGRTTQMVREFSKYVDEIVKGSEAAGVSTKLFQQFGFAVEQSGGTSEKAAMGLGELAKLIGQANSGVSEAAKKFERWGISLVDTNGYLLTTEQVLAAVAEKTKATTNQNLRAAMAADLFKKADKDLIVALKGGSKALDELMAKANVVDDDQIQSIKKLSDAWSAFTRSVNTEGGRTIGNLSTIANTVRDLLPKGFGDAAVSSFSGTIVPGLTAAKRAVAEAATIIGAIKRDFGIDGTALPLPERQKETDAAREARLKAEAKLAKEIADHQERRAKAQKEGAIAGETAAEKVARLEKELRDEQHKPTFRADTTELEDAKRLADIEEKRLELKKAQLDLQKDIAAQAKKEADARERLGKAESDLAAAVRERYGFTLEQLASAGSDFDAGAGVRGGSRRRNARRAQAAALSDPRLQGARMIQGVRDEASFRAGIGDISGAQFLQQQADQMASQFGAMFPGVLKPSEFEIFQSQLDELKEMRAAQQQVFLEGKALNVNVANAAE